MQWIDVCGTEDLVPNSGICALVSGQQVAIFSMIKDDTVFAIGNYDPIGKANVLSRGLIGDLKGQPVVASPLYKQHFNLETGQCLEQADVSVKTYAIRRVNDRIEVGI